MEKAKVYFTSFRTQVGTSWLEKLRRLCIAAGIKNIDMEGNEKELGKIEAIILSMTKEERANPQLMNPSRKKRIANGAGVDIADVNRLVKQFGEMRKMMKQLPGMMGGKRRGGFGGLGGMFGRKGLPFG